MATLLVGIDRSRDEIIGRLTDTRTKDPSGRRRVASMVGFAGIGKTTLVLAVFRGLESQFQCRAIVTASRTFDIKNVMRSILVQVVSSSRSSMEDAHPPMAGIEAWEAGQLADKIRENLQDKRYLVVIDDLWTTSAWEDIICILPDNNRDSIIITTTRNESVADICCSRYHPGDFVHTVASLDDLDSMKLFLGGIFGSEDNCPPQLKEVSKKILNKCAGLPLTIVCISRLLATKPTQTKVWEEVCNSLGSEMESNNILLRLKQALDLGYDDLPHHLKVCLLYLCAFPEGCKIERDRLTRRWIAEGFVAKMSGVGVQQVAESFFNELIKRNMIQAVDVDCFGEVHACKIHDVLFELMATKSFEENFVTLVGYHSNISRPQHSVRRLSLDCNAMADGLDFASFDMSKARSLTIHGDISSIDSIPGCRFLRTLDFESCVGIIISRHLRNIGDLLLLKYLSFKSTWISELPSQIGELKCLETLDLTQTNIREIPTEISGLVRLVHLIAGGAELPQGVGNMRSLETLCIRAAKKLSKEAVKELPMLKNLAKLDMSYLHQKRRRRSYDESLETGLPSIIGELGTRKLVSLHLNLMGYSVGLFVELQCALSPPPVFLQRLRMVGQMGGYWFQGVPMWIASLTELTDLELDISFQDERDLQILAELPMLIRLRLTLQEASKNGIVIQGPSFPSLKELSIKCRIMSMSFNQGAMPKLEKLELQFRGDQEDLSGIRFRMENLQCLEEFRFVVVLHKGFNNPNIELLKEAIKDAVNIDPNSLSLYMYK